MTPATLCQLTSTLVPAGEADNIRRDRHGIGGIGCGDPFLPIVPTVAVRVGEIGRAIGGQAVLLEPGVGDDRARSLELITIALDPHPIEEWARPERVGVRVGHGAGLTQGCSSLGLGKAGWRLQIGAPFQEISPVGHALPGDGHLGPIASGAQQAKGGQRIGRIRAYAPFLPVIQVVPIAVGIISGAVCR